MTTAEIKAAREALGLKQEPFAAMLGYGHQSRVSDIESGKKRAGPAVIRLLRAYLDGYRPSDWPMDTRNATD